MNEEHRERMPNEEEMREDEQEQRSQGAEERGDGETRGQGAPLPLTLSPPHPLSLSPWHGWPDVDGGPPDRACKGMVIRPWTTCGPPLAT